MAKRLLVLILMGTGLMLAVQGADKRTTQGDYVYMQNGSGVRVSIETYRAKAGWTPVVLSLGGTSVSAVMDRNGRVVHDWAKGQDKRGVALFTIELEKGRILLGREAHSIRIYEQNGVRTRFEIAEGAIALPLRLGQGNRAATLRFGGLEIPARVGATNPVRMTAKGFNKQVAVTARPTVPTGPKGRSSEAQLVPSRIRARGK